MAAGHSRNSSKYITEVSELTQHLRAWIVEQLRQPVIGPEEVVAGRKELCEDTRQALSTPSSGALAQPGFVLLHTASTIFDRDSLPISSPY